jgi:hypothetical protein
MLLLINTIQSDHTFIADVVDTSKLPDDIVKFFDSLPNGYFITSQEYGDWMEETEFDVSDYVDNQKIYPSLLSEHASIDKVINIEF